MTVDPVAQRIIEAFNKERDMIIFEECEKASREVRRRMKEKVASIVMQLHQEVRFQRDGDTLVITVCCEEKK
jgi:F0F1-type ATP synthase membrane subunit b/b'